MYSLIKRYMDNLTKEQVLSFANNKSIDLNNEELDFVYAFIKKNWEQIIKNPKMLNLDRYKTHFTEENFIKIKKLFLEYSSKYQGLI